MITNMITDDEDIDFDDYNLTVNDYSDFDIQPAKERNQLINFNQSKEGIGENTDLYQQIAEKDHYLMLAAEAGKVLLEKNQELTHHYESLQDDYLRKIEELEQERHHLKRELTDREQNYDSRMQDLQEEVTKLVGQLNQVQKTSRTFEKSHRSNYDDLSIQNDSLHKELDEILRREKFEVISQVRRRDLLKAHCQLKVCNRELMQQVRNLSNRIDTKPQNINSSQTRSNFSAELSADFIEGGPSKETVSNAVDYREIKKLKDEVAQLGEHKQFLEESLAVLLQEKEAILNTHKTSTTRVTSLEDEVSSLKQQILICQDDLSKTKKKNIQLNNQLEEYVLLQQSSQHVAGNSNNSLFNELEMSMSEVDMNFHAQSTPLKAKLNVDEELPDILVNSQSNLTLEKLKSDIINIYTKLRQVQSQLTDSEQSNNAFGEVSDDIVNNTDLVTKLVDHVIELIQEKVLTLGVIDARTDSPCRLDLDNCDILSQTDSQLSDRDADILEQQVHDLNQRLNIATTDLENAKRELASAQTAARENEEEAQSLAVKSKAQEREIESLRKERDIMLADTSMEDKLRKALEERDEALKRENDMCAKFEQSQCDMNKLNNQLIVAVQHKLQLSEQLEQWQFDMASLIDQQLANKIKQDNKKKSRKRSSVTTSKFFSAKFFSSRTNSKEASRSNTPTVK